MSVDWCQKMKKVRKLNLRSFLPWQLSEVAKLKIIQLLMIGSPFIRSNHTKVQTSIVFLLSVNKVQGMKLHIEWFSTSFRSSPSDSHLIKDSWSPALLHNTLHNPAKLNLSACYSIYFFYHCTMLEHGGSDKELFDSRLFDESQ